MNRFSDLPLQAFTQTLALNPIKSLFESNVMAASVQLLLGVYDTSHDDSKRDTVFDILPYSPLAKSADNEGKGYTGVLEKVKSSVARTITERSLFLLDEAEALCPRLKNLCWKFATSPGNRNTRIFLAMGLFSVRQIR